MIGQNVLGSVGCIIYIRLECVWLDVLYQVRMCLVECIILIGQNVLNWVYYIKLEYVRLDVLYYATAIVWKYELLNEIFILIGEHVFPPCHS